MDFARHCTDIVAQTELLTAGRTIALEASEAAWFVEVTGDTDLLDLWRRTSTFG